MHFLRTHRIALFVFLLALLVRSVYFGISYEFFNHDLVVTIGGADGYYEVSKNIIEGYGFSVKSGSSYVPYSFRPPLYHYFIAYTYLLFGSYWGVLALQILIGSALPVLAMRLLGFFSGSRALVTATGVFLAVEPFSTLFSIFFYSETLFMFSFFLSLYFLFKYLVDFRPLYVVVSAALLGVSVLIKPTPQYLPVVIAALLLWQAKINNSKKIFIHTGVYAAIFLIVLSPWLYRNYREFGVVGISPQQASNLYTVLVPSVLAVENKTSFQKEFNKLISSGVRGPNFTEFAQSDEYVSRAIPILLSHPVALAVVSANTALNFFIHDGMYDVLKHVGYRPTELMGKPALFLLLSDPLKLISHIKKELGRPTILILFGRILWVFITVAFVLGAIRYVREVGPNPYALAALAVIFYFLMAALLVGLGINARYRMPVNFFIVYFAAYYIGYRYTAFKAGRTAR